MPRVCLVCKIPLTADHALCAFCMAGMLRICEPVTRDEGRFKVKSLFSWRDRGPRALAWTVASLKHQAEVLPWLPLTAWMLNVYGPLKQAVFVPVPASAGANHALGMALALGHWTGFPVVQALSRGSTRAQKRLGRGERQDHRFEREVWNYCTDYTNVVIVDDVVTSGGTARAAFHALGRPQNCEVWCLMDRRPLAGERAR